MSENEKDKPDSVASNKDANKVIDFHQKQRDFERSQKELEKSLEPPIFNLPIVTKYFLAALVIIFLITEIILPVNYQEWVFIRLGFIPGRFTGNFPFDPFQLIAPLTHMFLHGSWLHIIMNGVMLLAFGSGIEKWIGGKKMIIIFFISGLCGILAHFILFINSIHPVVGASGGLSGLFAAALVMLSRENIGMNGRYGMWPFIVLWIGISVLFGMMGGPDNSVIAWAAHIGGFLGGFAAIKLLKI